MWKKMQGKSGIHRHCVTVHNRFQSFSPYEDFLIFETEPHKESRKHIPILK